MNDLQQFTKKHLALVVAVAFVVGGFAGALGDVAVDNGTRLLREADVPTLVSNEEPYEPLKGSEEDLVVSVIDKVNPAVVSIAISKDVSAYYNSTGPDVFSFDDFFEFGFPFQNPRPVPESEGGTQLQRVGGGSGFIIEPDGLIVTNRHVVSDEDAVYTVIMSDGKEYEAKVLARDPVQDLALVKIDAKDLPTLSLGDSDRLKIGQSVIAIGYALAEFGNTVTRGVVSGVGRRVEAGGALGESEVLEEAIQTDAAINPGNSGGPLLNLNGEVIGINTAISREGQLVGFAIPINSVKQTIESVRKEGRIVRPWLGVRYLLVTPRLAEQNKLNVNYGALIVRGESREDLAVIPSSPADKAGLAENDIILEINGVKLDERNSLAREITKYKVGDTVTLKVLHRGEEKEVKLKLEEFKNM